MDKKLILAVAGSGKTTYIVESLTSYKRSLIITYTNGNYNNILNKIIEKFDGIWPQNITLMKYFTFLYKFCYKPFLSDIYRDNGILFENNRNIQFKKEHIRYYMTQSNYLYSNRLSLLLYKEGIIDDIISRIETYFDEFIIDEVQDIAGRDFTFLEQLMKTNVNMLFVGDFFQHTYNTSRDGNANRNLFDDIAKYKNRFANKNIIPDMTTLMNSWRCSNSICNYISNNLGISIKSNRKDDTVIRFISDKEESYRIMNDNNIVKLHFNNSDKYGKFHRNWGDTKGEDCYNDVCIMLNKETMKKYKAGELTDLALLTRNKLYVAITRAHGNVYFIEESKAI